MKHKNVPVFILAGGLGTRLAEETTVKPKPMVEIGEVPILLHLMRWYYSFGFNDFIVCAGYLSWEIKKYFLTYQYRRNHLEIDHRSSLDAPATMLGKNKEQEKWRVRVIDTGSDCLTGGRVARAFDEVSKTDQFEDFAVTYGDGLSDVDLDAELKFHREHGKVGSVLGVRPLARFGELDVRDDNKVQSFLEKPQSRQGLINGGFFFFKKEFRAKYLKDSSDCFLEREPLAKLATDGQLMMFKHLGFWHPMDMIRDKVHLQGLWDSGKAPWKPRG